MSLSDSFPIRVPLIAAPVTPFAADGSLALGSVEALATRLVQQGVDGVFVNGTTGESHSLSAVERCQLAERWVSVLQGTALRCIIHVGSNCLQEARQLAVHAQKSGATGIAALAPSYFKPVDVEAWVESSAFIASGAPGLPFHAYDLPGMTGIHLASDQYLIQASQRIPTMAGLKFSNPDLVLLQRCVAALGPKQELLYGCDDLLLPALTLGATGAVGSTYNLAAPLYRAMQAAVVRGDWQLARRAQRHSIRLIEILSRSGYLGSLKVVMSHEGMAVGSVRLPLRSPTAHQSRELLGAWESWSAALAEIVAAKS
jgi:N-acetylneuraminate lyase